MTKMERRFLRQSERIEYWKQKLIFTISSFISPQLFGHGKWLKVANGCLGTLEAMETMRLPAPTCPSTSLRRNWLFMDTFALVLEFTALSILSFSQNVRGTLQRCFSMKWSQRSYISNICHQIFYQLAQWFHFCMTWRIYQPRCPKVLGQRPGGRYLRHCSFLIKSRGSSSAYTASQCWFLTSIITMISQAKEASSKLE